MKGFSLTPQQQRLLDWLREDPARQNSSFQEMADGIGLVSRSNIHRLLNGLEERGYVRRLRYRARSLELIGPLPANLGLRLIAGPHHFERRAAEKRRLWAMQEGRAAA